MTQRTRNNMPAVTVQGDAPGTRTTLPPPALPEEDARGRSALPGVPAPVRTAAELPDRRYFRIGEVAILLGVKPYVLRYWETEFPQVRPQKSRSGQRLYRRREVEVLLDIRTLLYDRGFTIVGARKALRELEDLRASGQLQQDLPPLPRPSEPPPTGTAMAAALGSLPPLHNISTIPPPMTASSAPTMIASQPSLPQGRAPSLPPAPVRVSAPPPPHGVPTAALGVSALSKTGPASAEQLSLHLALADSRLLEEIRDNVRDLLALCRDA